MKKGQQMKYRLTYKPAESDEEKIITLAGFPTTEEAERYARAAHPDWTIVSVEKLQKGEKAIQPKAPAKPAPAKKAGTGKKGSGKKKGAKDGD
jgi:hypothetical protein